MFLVMAIPKNLEIPLGNVSAKESFSEKLFNGDFLIVFFDIIN